MINELTRTVSRTSTTQRDVTVRRGVGSAGCRAVSAVPGCSEESRLLLAGQGG